MTRTRRRRITLLAGAGFFALQLAWILSMSPNFGIDEFEHSLRASSVAQGHWEPGTESLEPKLGRGELIPVRSDVAATVKGACQARQYAGTYNCVPKETLAGDEVLIVSGAGRYNPTFYAVVGTLAKPFHGVANLYAMRVATALIASALFLAAVGLALTGARTVWPLVTILIAALPTTVYSSSIVSPNGIEMIAGLGVWITLRSVVTADPAGGRRAGYGFLALCAAVLANTHTLGLLWLGLIVAAVAVLEGPARTLRALVPTGPRERLLALLGAGGVVFEAAWILYSGVNSTTAVSGDAFRGSSLPYIVNGLLLWPLQAIGAFPMRDDPAPALTMAAVLVALGLVTAWALRRTALGSRTTATLALVAVVSFVVPAILTARTFTQIGAAWQGRYGMPFTVGLILILGVALDRSTRPVAHARVYAVVIAVALVVAHLAGQISVMTTQRNWSDLVSATGWNPPNVLLLVALASIAACCWAGSVVLTTTGTRRTSPVPVVAPEPAREGAVR